MTEMVDDVRCCEPKFWVYLMLCVVFLTFACLTSGLSLGFFSYSQVDLEVLIKAGLPDQRKNAARILPIVKNQYLLLCTLLITKSLALEALPIFLDKIVPFWAAILISVTIVIAFAEVIPQAVCSRYGLGFSAKLVLFVRLLQVVVFPVAYPVSKLLDWLLGEDHSALLGRGQLKTLVDLLSVKAGRGGELTDDETTIITGALDMTQKTAKDAMTPISKIFSLDINAKLDMHTMGLIMSKGHSRVPFYADNPKNIIGLVLVKNLIFCDPDDRVPLKNITLRRIPRVYDDWPLYDVLKMFQKGHSHMAAVVQSPRDGKEAEDQKKRTPEFLDVRIQSDSKLAVIDVKGAHSPFRQREILSNFTDSSDTDQAQVSVVGNVETPYNLSVQSNKRKEEVGNTSVDELESLKAEFADEEVIGIITMEDVMEELLQEEILDETDLNVLQYKMNRMNSPPWLRSAARIQWRTPATSAFSSYHNTPVFHSPISPYAPQSPLIINASPGKSKLGSPSASSWFTVCSSPSSNQVSRKSYERLRHGGVL